MRKINWSAKFSEHESNEEALMRLFNEQQIKKECGNEGYLLALASLFNTTPMAINKKLGRLRKEGKVGTLHPGGTWGTKRLVTIDKKFPGKFLPQRLLKLIADGNRLLAERDVRQEEVFPEYDYKGWVGLVVAGDWHIEDYRTDTDAVIEMLKKIGREPNLFYGFNGDAGNFIDIRFLELENETIDIPLRRRYEIIEDLFSLVPNTLFAVLGCHDQWVHTRARYDIIEAIQGKILGYYLGFGGIVNFKVGNVTYRIAAYHKFGNESMYNDFHPCYNFLRKYDADVDVICVAHRHDKVGISQVYWQGRPRIFIRSGSEQYKTEYAWREGFFGAVNRYPMFLMNGTEKRMIAVCNYGEGIQILRALNSGELDGDALLEAGREKFKKKIGQRIHS